MYRFRLILQKKNFVSVRYNLFTNCKIKYPFICGLCEYDNMPTLPSKYYYPNLCKYIANAVISNPMHLYLSNLDVNMDAESIVFGCHNTST